MRRFVKRCSKILSALYWGDEDWEIVDGLKISAKEYFEMKNYLRIKLKEYVEI